MRGFQVVGSRNQIKREGDLSWHGMNHNEQKITRLKFPALQVTKRSFLFLICFHVVGLSFFTTTVIVKALIITITINNKLFCPIFCLSTGMSIWWSSHADATEIIFSSNVKEISAIVRFCEHQGLNREIL